MKFHRIIIIGRFQFNFYEKSFSKALAKIGFEVLEYDTGYKNNILSVLHKIEEYLVISGPLSLYINYKFKRYIQVHRPSIIFFWRPILFDSLFLKSIKNILPGTLLISYNNDNPFGREYQNRSKYLKRLWSIFKLGIPCYDINLVYRPSNILNYNEFGSKKTILFPPAFIPEEIPSKINSAFDYDIIFIGHCESKRLLYINFLLENGKDVKLFGPNWIQSDIPLYKYGKVESIIGKNYYYELHKAKIVLAFLSELNEDVYTRRNFEIPASSCLMLSERTEELEDLFKENVEAFYFTSKEELLEKINIILSNSDLQETVRKNAYKRSISSGYDIYKRTEKLMNQIFLQ